VHVTPKSCFKIERCRKAKRSFKNDGTQDNAGWLQKVRFESLIIYV
jgi:hypothetical protein